MKVRGLRQGISEHSLGTSHGWGEGLSTLAVGAAGGMEVRTGSEEPLPELTRMEAQDVGSPTILSPHGLNIQGLAGVTFDLEDAMLGLEPSETVETCRAGASGFSPLQEEQAVVFNIHLSSLRAN